MLLEGGVTQNNYLDKDGKLKVLDDVYAAKIRENVTPYIDDYIKEKKDFSNWKKRAYAGEVAQLLSGLVPMGTIGNLAVRGLVSGLAGGGLFGLGRGLVEDENPLKTAAHDAVIGGLTGGAIPVVGGAIGKTKAGQAIGSKLDDAFKKFAETKAYDALMSEFAPIKNWNKQTVYHGSPYDFNKFSNDAIGTGEGAQAHGYGHYAAKNKDVASDYAEGLSKGKENQPFIVYDNQKYDFKYGNDILDNPVKPFLAEVYNSGKNYKDVVNKYLKSYEDGIRKLTDPKELEYYRALGTDLSNIDKDISKYNEAINFVKNFDINKLQRKSNKQLYKLSIPKNDVMLREDATFAEQPKKVQKAIKEIIKENPDLAEIIDTRTKEDLFAQAEKAAGKNGKKIIQEIFDAELSGNDNKIANAWDKWDALEVKNEGLRERFDPNQVYGYLRNYRGNSLDDVDRVFTNKTSNTNLYKFLEDEKNYNKALYDKGIKGISYNGGIDGEANVIFNPDDINIVRKYYNQPSLSEQLNKGSIGSLSNSIKDAYDKAIKSTTKQDILNSFEQFRKDPNLKELKLSNVRTDLKEISGTNDIYLLQGNEKGGMKHILVKHPEDIDIIVDTLQNGQITKVIPKRKVFISSDNGHCILSLDYNGKEKCWLLTGYGKN